MIFQAKQKENWFLQHPRLYFRMSRLSSRVPHSDWFRKSTCPFPNNKSQIGNKGFSPMGRDMSKPYLIKPVLFALLESASVVWTFQETLLWPRPGRHSQSWRLTKRLTKRDFTKCCGQMQAGYDRLPIYLFILSIYVNQSISWFGYGHAAHLKTLLVRNQSAFGKCAKALWQIHYFMIRK